MLNSLLNKLNPTPSNFLKELYKLEFSTKVLDKLLESNKFDINYQDEDKNTFLNLCLLKNKNKSAQWLISKGINVSLENNNGDDAVNIAILKDNHLMLNYILEKTNANVNKLDNEQRSLLQNAVIHGQEKIVRVLLAHGAEVNHVDKNNRNVVFDAISYGDEHIIDAILSVEDIDLNLVDKNGETILHKKEIQDNTNLCKKLIQKGADPTICDEDGKNFLCNMALKGMDGIELIDLAVDSGYSLNTPVKNNNTILMEALSVFYGLPEDEQERRKSLLNMASSLVQKGVDINALNEYGENALFEAVRNNNYESCLFLIENKININKQNRLRQTPLLLACYKGIEYLDIILLLLHKGANPTIKNELNQDVLEILNQLILHTRKYKILKNNFILMYLNEKGQYLLVLKEILSNSKFNLKKLDSFHQPLFFNAILFGDYELFKLYMVNGFDINQKNKKGLNIFFVYVNFVFSVNRYFDKFRTMLIRLIQEKVEVGEVDDSGKSIFSKVIKEDTNPNLYEDLLEVCRFKYDSQDNQGRTFMHYAVLHKNLEIVKMIYSKDNEVVNISDNYGLLPIAYAALMGYFDIVEYILSNSNIYIKSRKIIPTIVKKKFAPMLKNIDNLKNKATDNDMLRKITILTDQIKSDLKL